MNSPDEPKYLHDRRFVPKRQYEVKTLWQNHEQMLRLVCLGHTNEHIAQVCGVTPQTVSNVRNSPIAKGKLEQLRGALDAEAIDIGARIQEFAPVALRLLEDVISGEVEAPIAIRAKYASVHLGRAGFGEVTKIASVSTHLTRDDIELIKMRAVDSAREAGLIVED